MYNEEVAFAKKTMWYLIGVVIILSVCIGTCTYLTRTAASVTHANDIVETYEQFQEIYNTCQKLNTDLSIIQATDEKDKQFDQFSKTQRLNAIKQNLNRWVEDYNAKSKMWGRSLWKSKSLPYQLSVTDFSNYK